MFSAKRLVAGLAIAVMLLVGLAGTAFADNGDPNGACKSRTTIRVGTTCYVIYIPSGREVSHGMLGVTVSRPTPADRSASHIAVDGGARVDAVLPDSAAATAGLKVGDVVVAVNGQPVRDGDHFVRRLAMSDATKPVSCGRCDSCGAAWWHPRG